jgi:hypothetical protein
MAHAMLAAVAAATVALAMPVGVSAAENPCKKLETKEACERNEQCRWVTPEEEEKPVCIPKPQTKQGFE